MPRPTRLRFSRACAGLSDERFSSLAMLDLHEVTDLPKHACEDRALVVLGGLADLSEPERPQRAAVLLGLADLTTYLRYSNLRHRSSVPTLPAARALYRG